MKSILKIILILSLCLNFLFAANKNRSIVIQFNDQHQFLFAGYYMAKEKGFFKRHGLDVTLLQKNSKTKAKANYFIGNSEVILDKLNKKKLILLASILQESPIVLISRKSTSINKIQDLEQITLSSKDKKKFSTEILTLLQSQNIKLRSLKKISSKDSLQTFIKNKVQIIETDMIQSPYILKQKDIAYKTIYPKDFGLDFYSSILYTTQKELTLNPYRVHQVYSAVLEGWKYALTNQEETVQTILNKYNPRKKSKDALKSEAKIITKLSAFNQGKLGSIQEHKIEKIIKTFLILGLSKESIPNINDFIFDQNKIILNQEEKKYSTNALVTYIPTMQYPFSYEKNKKIEGIEVDLNEIIKKKTQLNVYYKPLNTSNEIKKQLHSRNSSFKLLTSRYELSDDLLVTSQVITTYKVALATKIDKNYIQHTSLLNNKTVAIQRHALFYDDIIKDYPYIKFIHVNSIDEGLKMLESNKVFAFIDVLPPLLKALSSSNDSNLKISGITEYSHELKYILNKNNTSLLSLLNKSIFKLKQEQILRINNKYITIEYDHIKNFSWVYKYALPILLLVVFIIYTNLRLAKELQRRKLAENNLEMQSLRDDLTGVFNRKKCDELLETSFQLSRRYKRPLSIVFFDIDSLKKINNDYGHKKGDQMLIELTSVMQQNIRNVDFFGRWSAKEFLIILPETPLADARTTAQNLKNIIESHNFLLASKVNCSFGVSSLDTKDTIDSILTRVEHQVSHSKRYKL